MKSSAPIILFDTLREAHLSIIGRAIASLALSGGQLFCAGSSGVEYALVAHWRKQKQVRSIIKQNENGSKKKKSSPAANQIIVVSGSCSPVTDRQIDRAVQDGFVEIACDSQLLADSRHCAQGVIDAMKTAQPALDSGQSVIFQTARGPADNRRSAFERVAKNYGGKTKTENLAAAGESLGRGLAQILQQALQRTGAQRAVVCGGDTSTHLARELGIEALEFVAPVAPGSPLCRVHAPDRIADGCEIIFKGGQVGRDSFFNNFQTGTTI